MKIGPAILAAVVFAGAGCSTKSDVVELRTTLLAELQADRSQRDSLIAEIRQLRAVLLDSLNVQQRRDISGRVDLQRQLQDLNANLGQLIALTGETQRLLARRSAEGAAAAEGGQGGPPAPTGEEAAGGGGGVGIPAEPAAAEDPSDLYEAALRQFRRGSYGTARTALDEFLSRHPGHDLAPDAQYFRAETFAEEGDAPAALREYARVLELHPNSRRAPTALYKSGLLELRRGNIDDARTFFNRIVQGYPDSDEVELARRELDRLRR
ncbi:MAG: tol-pal system protein YbgF [Gemmatimonadota bacterium]|nr:tol-pal system protein YbgF [Gemmatimonadota bacterium]